MKRDEAERRVGAVLYEGREDAVPIEQADPYSMGVFASDAANQYRAQAGSRPPYVKRSIDDVLRPAVGALAKSGGLVVVRGDPKSGKSRTLWTALVDQVGWRDVWGLKPPVAGEHTVEPVTTFVNEGVELDGRRSITWVDDAHEHFGHGLTRRPLLGGTQPPM